MATTAAPQPLQHPELDKRKTPSLPPLSYLVNVVAVAAFLIAMIWLMTRLLADGLYMLMSIITAITVFIALVYLRPRFTPLRWLGIGIALSMLFTVFPIVYTFYLSVTNMGSGHLMSKQQAIARLEEQLYLPEDGQKFSWTAFESTDGEYALWLIDEAGNAFWARAGQPRQTAAESGITDLDADGVPTQITGYQRLERRQTVPIISDLSEIEFGQAPDAVLIRSLGEAAALKSLYQYDASRDVMINQETGAEFVPIEGTFTSADGETLTPGYIVVIGFKNFADFLGNAGLRQPMLGMLGWNISFAFLTVFVSFAVGLIVTLLFDDLPGREIIRALLIIPWPIPVLVSVLIWRSMLHPDMGFVAPFLERLFGASPAWFQDKFWTRFALVMVNVWLSYPYFYVITAGAMRAISQDMFDAAVVDGANPLQKLRFITMPLLIRILMPLLIASFTFNFNNFNVIYIFNYGGPPMPNTLVPMGHTDILISFVYRLAFVTSNVTNYGLAAAITVILFLFITLMVLIQTRFTRRFEEAAS